MRRDSKQWLVAMYLAAQYISNELKPEIETWKLPESMSGGERERRRRLLLSRLLISLTMFSSLRFPIPIVCASFIRDLVQCLDLCPQALTEVMSTMDPTVPFPEVLPGKRDTDAVVSAAREAHRQLGIESTLLTTEYSVGSVPPLYSRIS